MKNDHFFENSCLFSDAVLFAILCYTLFLGVSGTFALAVVVAGIALTAVAFVTMCYKRLTAMDRPAKKHSNKIAHGHA